MKKIVGPLCSFLAGVMTFVFLSIPYFITKISSEGAEDVTKAENAWQMLKNYNASTNGYLMFKVATIIMIALASLLIIWSVLLLLNNFNIINHELINFNLMNTVVLFLLVVATMIQMIALLMMGNFVGGTIAGTITNTYTGVGLWLNVAQSTITFLVALVFTKSISLIQNND